ncbi:peptidylprolyl isomerase [Thiohalobacter sp. IOR34]|uniref:FKBP-type peptidyl-prolyl cis-trans isomerase n=1 Tax=Thiohalobacter sp. IOR34 TaxID=3057176 RepID=UPI0025B1E93C|nr:peptidylprolyl isomerase [Thiohalobacter sp. IOR34]WJW75488.1 peptidylprolyl isomerase [Thiohalobacter sp. IOR34]
MADERVAKNRVVSITYTISDEQGNLLEQSDLPITYLHGGRNDLFESIEAALEGCRVGDRVEVTLTPEEGFGAHDPNLTFTDKLENVPPQFRRLGVEVEMQNDRGESRIFIVTHMDEETLTVDGNHPFAGKTLIYSVKVDNVREATPEELKHGVQQGVMTH